MSTYILLKDWLVPGLGGQIVRSGTKFLKLSEKAYQGEGGWIFHKDVVEHTDWFAKEEEPKDVLDEQSAVHLLIGKGYKIYQPRLYGEVFEITDVKYTETDLRKAFEASREKMAQSTLNKFYAFDNYLHYIKTINS